MSKESEPITLVDYFSVQIGILSVLNSKSFVCLTAI